MKIASLKLSAIIASTMLVMASCSKEDNDTTETRSCKIITLTETGATYSNTYNLSYNNDGKISVLEESGGSGTRRVFTYSGNTINVSESNNSGPTSTTVVTLNNRGRVQKTVETRISNSKVTTQNFEYDGDGTLLKSTYKYDTDPLETSIYQSSNANITTITQDTNVTQLEYFTNKPFQIADYFNITQLIRFGAVYVRNKHLLKSINNNGSIANLNYQTDSEGRVTKFDVTQGSNISSISIQYKCE